MCLLSLFLNIIKNIWDVLVIYSQDTQCRYVWNAAMSESCGFCFEFENFDPALLCIITVESSWIDFWNHLQKKIHHMINGSAESTGGKWYDYSCCFKQTIYLLFTAEQTGAAWWFGLCRRPQEGLKCQEDVSVEHVFILLLPVYIRNLATSENCIVVQFQ